ncbi:FAD-binding and (Fe-S)-binding domain-containing protein [Crenobacter luteus]|uniref:D-lactate dehydrogenase (cytochrome) n=1 Tax=Crenobacter luteus TaxID=1452487 RepID=A0A165EMQ0_9NEIS|nr:FAD-binding and (Fe-S)-binding domain-containing protein [Crenobacter luteus]KZE25977.1 4Fe-4S ferredoxin [Crenobacter luteus]
MSAAHQSFATALAGFVPAGRIYTDPISTLAFGTDASFYRLVPQVVVKVDCETEVGHVLRLAREHRVAVTFRAAGTSLSGQAVSDSVLVVLGDGFARGEVLDGGARIRLKPGLIGSRANALLAPFGRKIGPDPASIATAKIGGIAANNSSGMCCGTRQNSYHTLASLRVMLADGAVLDTGDAKSVAAFRQSHARLLQTLAELSANIRADAALEEKIRHKYRLKNTTGYGINALIDFSDPIDMLAHLMIGSEGTLGFIGEITYHTVPDHPHKASALVLFDELDRCCRAVTALKQSAPVESVELIDARSLRAIQGKKGLPDFIYGEIGDSTACLLIETRAENAARLAEQIVASDAVLAEFAPSAHSGFSTDAGVCETYWAVRKGLFPAVGAVRPVGTTVVIEDVAFPIDYLADGVRRLTALFDAYGYAEALIFGHALEGNLHFCFTPSFDTQAEIERYDGFMQAVADLVAGEYGGSLKAEHGTGRNVAPFVRQEWGDAAYAVMCAIKAAFDPDNLLNPDVIISGNARVHLENLKAMPAADAIVDHCIECGFCEPACPSNGLTLTPRQRIVLWRRMQQLSRTDPASSELAAYRARYRYVGVDSCAATGMCATRCPVGIDTGRLMKKLGAPGSPSPLARFAQRHMAAATAGARFGLFLNRQLGDSSAKVARTLKKTFPLLPLPPSGTPGPAGPLPDPKPMRAADMPQVVYLVSCVNRTLAEGRDGSDSVAASTLRLFARAGIAAVYPDGQASLCCGQPFDSAGATSAADAALAAIEAALLKASKHGAIPVYLDNSPCSLRLIDAQKAGRLDARLELHDPASYLAEHVLPRLTLHKKLPQLAVHVPCSASKMGVGGKLLALARACADEIVAPDIACCGFAGSKGFTLPELNANGLRGLRASLPDTCDAGVSMSRTCQIGLTTHSGRDYHSIEALLDFCTTPEPPRT